MLPCRHSQGTLNSLLLLFHADRHSLLTTLYPATQKLIEVFHISSYATEITFHMHQWIDIPHTLVYTPHP